MKTTAKISILLIFALLFLSLTNCSVPSSIKEKQEGQTVENQSDQTAGEKSSQPLEKPNPYDGTKQSDGTSSPEYPGNDYFIFVDIINGHDGATGTSGDPVDDINEGIDTAFQQNKDVCVAEGIYDAGGCIKMKSGVAVYGGYSNDMLWNRNLYRYKTTIKGHYSPNPPKDCVVYFDSQTDNSSVLDGFTIIGYNYLRSYGIYCESARGKISNNKIYGPPRNNPDYYHNIYYRNSFMIISNNEIFAGAKKENSCIMSCGSSSYIINNIIHGGNCLESFGIDISQSTYTYIRDNEIYPGESTSYTFGISMTGDGLIEGNIIHAGKSAQTYGVHVSNRGLRNTIIQNNTINGGEGEDTSYGINIWAGHNLTIADNTINGGDGEGVSYGINLDSHSNNLVITGNNINGGNGTNTAKEASYGINVNYGTDVIINENIINSGQGFYSYCIYLRPLATPNIKNNFLKCWYSKASMRWGIYEENNDTEPMYVIGNTFNISLTLGSTGGYYRDYSNNNSHKVIKLSDLNALDEDGYNLANSVYDNKFSNILPLPPSL